MRSVLLLTNSLQPSMDVLPALGLLPYTVKVLPAEGAALLESPPVDAVLIIGERLGTLGWTGLAVIAVVLVILAFAPTNADHHPPAATSPSNTVAAVR